MEYISFTWSPDVCMKGSEVNVESNSYSLAAKF